MLAYVLDKNIDGQRLLQDITRLVSNYKNDSPDKTPVLVINITNIVSDDTSLIKKLEDKRDCIS